VTEPSSERGPRPFGPRRMAEWLSFGVSLALILAVVVYLVGRVLEPSAPVIDARVTPLLDQAKRQGSRFVLPVEVENRSPRSVRDLQISIHYELDGRPQSMDFVLDYVGQTSRQIVYAYFREDPRGISIRAEPLSYRVD
jgi:uncharacterized protein (TIGR02588 family)